MVILVLTTCLVLALTAPALEVAALVVLALVLFGLVAGPMADAHRNDAFLAFGPPLDEIDHPGPRRKRSWRDRPAVPVSKEVDDEPWRRERERRAQRRAGTTKS